MAVFNDAELTTLSRLVIRTLLGANRNKPALRAAAAEVESQLRGAVRTTLHARIETVAAGQFSANDKDVIIVATVIELAHQRGIL